MMPAVTVWAFVQLVSAKVGAGVGSSISFALGVYLGYLLLVPIYKLSSSVGFSVFSTLFVVALLGITVLSLLTVSAFRTSQQVKFGVDRDFRCGLLWFAVAINVGALLLFAGYQHVWHPLQSWDALSFWGRNATFVLRAEEGGISVGDYWNRHPMTISIISAWSAWSAQAAGGDMLLFVPWLLAWTAIGTVTYSFGCMFNLERSACLVLASAALSIPLLDNHALLSGYGEIYNALGISLAVFFLIKGQQNGYDKNWFFGACLGFTLLVYKNIGAIYVACIVSGAISSWMWGISKKLLITIFSAIILAVLAANYYNVSFFFMENRIGFDHNSDDVFFGGYRLKQEGGTALTIFQNQVHALLINSSYSVAFLSLLVIAIAQLIYLRSSKAALVIIVPVLGVMLFGFSQVFDLAYIYATPENDTGNSRFMLPIMALTPMSLVPVIAWAQSAPKVGIAPQRIK